MTEQNTQFNYLLNAFERASQADRPVDHGYRDKREALIAHVRELERKAEETEKLRAVCADLMSVRDQFAKAALQGLCANSGGPFQANGMSGWGVVNTTFYGIASDAYALADAMIRARNGLSPEVPHD